MALQPLDELGQGILPQEVRVVNAPCADNEAMQLPRQTTVSLSLASPGQARIMQGKFCLPQHDSSPNKGGADKEQTESAGQSAHRKEQGEEEKAEEEGKHKRSGRGRGKAQKAGQRERESTEGQAEEDGKRRRSGNRGRGKA